MAVSWNNDPALKADAVQRMIEHRAADEIVQGFFQRANKDNPQEYRGCAVGCLLPSRWTEAGDAEYQRLTPYLHRNEDWVEILLDEDGSFIEWHQEVEQYFGIDQEFAELIDSAFEAQPDFEAAARFAVDIVKAIPVGVDLGPVAQNILDEEEAFYERDDDDYDTFGLARALFDRLAQLEDKN